MFVRFGVAVAGTAAMLGGCATAQPGEPLALASVVGPIAFTCEGMVDPVNATFLNGSASSVHLVWPGHDISLPQGLSADGGRYTGSAEGGTWTFWNKGQGAMFTRPDGSMINCTEQKSK